MRGEKLRMLIKGKNAVKGMGVGRLKEKLTELVTVTKNAEERYGC